MQGLRVPITGLQKLQKASQTLYMTSQRTTGDRHAHQHALFLYMQGLHV